MYFKRAIFFYKVTAINSITKRVCVTCPECGQPGTVCPECGQPGTVFLVLPVTEALQHDARVFPRQVVGRLPQVHRHKPTPLPEPVTCIHVLHFTLMLI